MATGEPTDKHSTHSSRTRKFETHAHKLIVQDHTKTANFPRSDKESTLERSLVDLLDEANTKKAQQFSIIPAVMLLYQVVRL